MSGYGGVLGARREWAAAVGEGRLIGADWKAESALDREEFTDFYASSFQRLVSQLYAMTGDRAEAQDAVQEAFARAWVHRGQLDRDGAPEAWVRVTAWRIAMSRWRRAWRGRFLTRPVAPPPGADGPDLERLAVIEALSKIPLEQRRAIVLHYLCDLTVAQIAAETGVPVGTVKARLARGRAALAPYLTEGAPAVLRSLGEQEAGDA